MPLVPADTLLSVLACRARRRAGRPALHFGGTSFSYRDLWSAAESFAAFLRSRKIDRGDRVVLALPNGPEFFIGFYGTQLAGGIAVPLFPESGPERIFSVASICGAEHVVVPSRIAKGSLQAFKQLALRVSKRVFTIKETSASVNRSRNPKVRPEDIAFIQYTSGSTGDPKGVCLTHAGILTNIGQMVEGMEITKDDVFVSWLPVHHDMGLILMTMVPFCLNAECHLLPSTLLNIRRWISTISSSGGTFTAAPDFAYRWALVYTKHPGRYNLSRLRVALNAAEPVRAKTIRSFHNAFGLADSMTPAYGLAEATVGVSSWRPGRPVKVDDRGFVSVGRPFPGIEVGILRKGELAGSGVPGEIVLKSPANTPGYFENPTATHRLFWKDGYLHTGDLGYMDADGDLFIIGREKNIIIQSGQNISPQEVEETVDGLPFVRLSAAVGIDRGGVDGEQVYIFTEIKTKPGPAAEELRALSAEVVQRFVLRMGYRPGRVYLLKPRSIPRTPNGKVRYHALKSRYLNGSLRREGRILFPDY